MVAFAGLTLTTAGVIDFASNTPSPNIITPEETKLLRDRGMLQFKKDTILAVREDLRSSEMIANEAIYTKEIDKLDNDPILMDAMNRPKIPKKDVGKDFVLIVAGLAAAIPSTVIGMRQTEKGASVGTS